MWQYLKAHPTPGPESTLSVASDGKLRFLDSHYGRISAAICYDMDFPRLIAQAGRHRADILLSPASDWRAIDPRHTQIASFRAIEEGFNLVRQANAGLSAAYDYQGHRLAAVDAYTSPNAALIAEIPTQGTLTIYSILGDWFAYLCIACSCWHWQFSRGGALVHCQSLILVCRACDTFFNRSGTPILREILRFFF